MKILIFLILYIMSIINGNGPGDKEPGKDYRKYQKGMIVNFDNTANKGCGWMIEVEGHTFKPKNLSKAFYKDSMVVKLDYEKSLTIYKCEKATPGFQEIYINWMEKSK